MRGAMPPSRRDTRPRLPPRPHAGPGPRHAWATALFALGLAACSQGQEAPMAQEQPTAPDAHKAHAQANEAQWQCGDQHVATRHDADADNLVVTHARGQLQLPVEHGASTSAGQHFADANGNAFWIEGDKAGLTLSGIPERACQGISAGGGLATRTSLPG